MPSFLTLDQFQILLEVERPVVLLEGTRSVSPEEAPRLETFGAALARRFPAAIFRSGNAPGSDESFSRGVASVDASRLELVVPYARHRLRERIEGARVLSLDAVEDQEELRRLTLLASPFYEFLARSPNVSRKASFGYLLRDALKVTGDAQHDFAPATVGLFFVNAAKPTSGGTAHTLRVCQSLGVATATQNEWQLWDDRKNEAPHPVS